MTARCVVVTPYHRESRHNLERCIESVRKQTIAVDHILVADGFPQDWIDRKPVRHIKLDREHKNYGNTPRCVGAMVAVASDYDAIALLDADNWLDPIHCEYCLQISSPKGENAYDFVIAQRRFVRPDLSVIPIPDEPLTMLLDTNCCFYLKTSFYTLPVWGLMPNQLGIIGDRVVWHNIKSQSLRAIRAHAKTVNYVTLHKGHYEIIGETPPREGSKRLDFVPVVEWINSLPKSEVDRIAKLVGFRIDEFTYTPRE